MVLEITFDDARRRVDTAAGELESLTVPQRDRAAAAASARSRLDAANAALASLLGLVQEATKAQRELAAAEARLSATDQAVHAARLANVNATSALEGARSRLAQAEQNRAQVPALQQQLTAANAEAAGLQRQIAELESAFVDFDLDEGPYGKPRPGASIRRAQITALNVRLNAARARANDAAARLAAIGDAEAAVQAASAAVQQAAAEVGTTVVRLENAQREHAAAAQVVAAARARVTELQGSAGAVLRSQVAAAESELARLDAQLAEIATRVRNHIPPRRPRIPDWKFPDGWEPEPLDDPVLDQLLATQAQLSGQRAAAATRAAELRNRLNALLGPDAELPAARAEAAAAGTAWSAAQAELQHAEAAVREAAQRLEQAEAALARVVDVRDVLAAGGPTAQDIERATAAIEEWTAAAESLPAGNAEQTARRDALLGELGDASLSVQVVAVLGVAPAVPAVLLPVRLETRYDKGSSGSTDLIVRIYPDEIAVDTHEQGLTTDEAAWGSRFWDEQARGDDEGLAAWAGLADRFGAARAAWITKATRPGADRPAEREASWTRAASVWALPDRWLVLAYRDGKRVAWTLSEQPVRRPLPVGPTPGAKRNGHATDPGMRWMVDLYEAYAAGMAARLSGVGTDIDRVVVLGVRPDADGTQDLAALLDAHHFTDGLELLAHGTSTNSTKGDPAGWSSVDPGHVRSHARERGKVRVADGDGGAGDRMARALGVPASAFAQVAGATARTDELPGAMNAALWPATWGYLLGERLGLSDAVVTPVRDHFVSWVRARGPLGVLRVGRQPYGVLPVISLDRWQPAAGEDGLEHLADLLARFRDTWAAAGRAALAADDSGEGLLARTPGATEVRAHGEFVVDRSGWFARAKGFMGMSRDDVDRALELEDRSLLLADRSIRRHLPRRTRTIHRPAPGQAGWPLAEGLHLADPHGGTAGHLSPDYLDWLATATPTAVETETGRGEATDALLYLMLRQGRRLGDTAAAIGAFRDVPADELARLMLDTFDLATHRFDAWATSLATRRLLAASPSDRADRPDRASRSDWAVRGSAARARVVLGAYGWLDGPWPERNATEVPRKERPANEPAGLLVDDLSTGYIHAPSVPQAVTSAVLRSAQLGRRTSGADPLAIDLSSRRVRLANDLLDGVRQGQPLAALLGYRLERTLHETGNPGLVGAFREVAPLAAVGATARSGSAGTATVDGLAVIRASRAKALPFQTAAGRRTAPWNTAASVSAAEAAIAVLEDALDAVDDATLAEAVHHTLQGNYERASAHLVARSRGEVAPPELEFVRTPRTGVGLTHRVAVLTPAAKPGAGWSAARPRVRAEPRLAAWAEALLGPSNRVSVTVEARDRSSGAVLPLPDSHAKLRLSELGLAALDVLAIADQPADLDRLLAAHVLAPSRRPASVPVDADIRAVPDAAPVGGAELGLGDLLALARSATRLLGVSRPLDAADLALPGSATPRGTELVELGKRAEAAVKELARVLGSLDAALGKQPGNPADPPRVARTTRCRSALAAAWAAGVTGAVPEPGDDETEAGRTALARSALGTRAELARRLEAARAALDSGAEDRAGSLVTAIKAVFGESFTVLPVFAPADAGLLAAAVAATDLTVEDPGQGADAWFAKVAQVREPLAALQTLTHASEAVGTGVPLSLLVGQLPLPDAGRQPWAGLPLADATSAANRLSLVLAGGRSPAASGSAARSVAGLLVDEWVESIPQRRETTAVTFHYQAPGAQAPQAVLVAVPPRADAVAWDISDLEATVLETIDLVHARTADLADLDAYAAAAPPDSVDAARLSAYRSLLPAIAVPTPAANERHGVEPSRLASVPPTYGVVDSEQAPTISAIGVVGASEPVAEQGDSVVLTVSGQQLEGGEYLVNPRDGVTLVVESATATAARIRLTVAPDAPAGQRGLHYRKPLGGEASAGLRITPRPRIDGVSRPLLQQSSFPSQADVVLTGHHLAGLSLVRVEGGPGLGVSVTATSESTATLKVTVPASRQPTTVSDWDPLDRGGPLKPPRPMPVESYRRDAAVRVVLRTAARNGRPAAEVTAALTVSELHWRTTE